MSESVTTKKKTSVSLSDEAQRLLGLLSRQRGVSKSDILEMLIRDEAQRRGINPTQAALEL